MAMPYKFEDWLISSRLMLGLIFEPYRTINFESLEAFGLFFVRQPQDNADHRR